MFRKMSEWWSVRAAKNPGRMVLLAIFLFNLGLLALAAFIISSFKIPGTEGMGFFEAVYYSITMLLDAGCISFVVEEISPANAVIAAICIIFILMGMISFTGTIIGYVTNSISNYIDAANDGNKPLKVSGHVVILNWNTRASEIVNDLLYSDHPKKVVILASYGRKQEIEQELAERLADTIRKENASGNGKLKNRLTIIVREGDVFSSKQLYDVSLLRAKTIIILGDDGRQAGGGEAAEGKDDGRTRGNSQTIKTLMQVAEITASEESEDNQKIIVEITDDWTSELVNKIIKCKQVDGKCNIVPVRVNRVLGQILSQFSLMPELNLAYKDLFSNKGMTFYAREDEWQDDKSFVTGYLKNHAHAIPLTHLEIKGKTYAFYAAGCEADVERTSSMERRSGYQVKLNRKFWIEDKMVLILGHNDKCRDIMEGFQSFYREWGHTAADDVKEVLSIVVIDDEKFLKKMNYYKEYPFVKRIISAEIYDKELISKTIDECLTGRTEDVSILILSEDDAPSGDVDAKALANLVYVQEIIMDKKKANPDFDVESLDVIVEIIDPKHHDVVSSYGPKFAGETRDVVNNVVISNRYVSKMITQIGEKDVLYDFYRDILTYDEDGADGFQSKEIYAKKVDKYFETIPEETTVGEFVRALFEASIDPSIPEEQQSPAVALGYVKPGGRMTLFAGNQKDQKIHLEKNDKLILYTNH